MEQEGINVMRSNMERGLLPFSFVAPGDHPPREDQEQRNKDDRMSNKRNDLREEGQNPQRA